MDVDPELQRRRREGRCPTCNHQTREGKEADTEFNRLFPIYAKDFKGKAVWQVLAEARAVLSHQRGAIGDITRGWPLHAHHTEAYEGAITTLLVAMYHGIEDIQKQEFKALGDGTVRWHSRGVGMDGTPGCFVCGAEKRNQKPDTNDYMNNVAAFVDSKEAGELAVVIIGQGARLDYRDRTPNRVQVKVGACDHHLAQLGELSRCWYINAERIAEVRAFVPESLRPPKEES